MSKRPIDRRIVLNPDEPRAGDFPVDFYHRSHPVMGDEETVSYLRSELAGLRGKRVTATLTGFRRNPDNPEQVQRFRISKEMTINRYTDVFGPGSFYGKAQHQSRDKNSSWEFVVQTLIIHSA